MSPEQTRAAAEVMLAWAKLAEEKGEAYANELLEVKGHPYRDWTCVTKTRVGYPVWDWVDFTYRVKPEPREWWIVCGGNTYCGNAWFKKADAASSANLGNHPIIHVREVIEV